MFDRETVITHLQIIHTWAAFAREHDLQFFTEKHLEDIASWTDDALALMKGNETQIQYRDDHIAEYQREIKRLGERLKELEETIRLTKNVVDRYANILADKGVNGVWVRYAVKKGKHFMAEYQNKKASWCYGLDGAWMSFDREMAEGFAKLTKGKLIEVTLTERPLND